MKHLIKKILVIAFQVGLPINNKYYGWSLQASYPHFSHDGRLKKKLSYDPRSLEL